MAEETAGKFGSREWFKAWGERLINGAIQGVSNAITTGTTGKPSGKATEQGAGRIFQTALSWLPYALIGGAALILLLALKKKA